MCEARGQFFTYDTSLASPERIILDFCPEGQESGVVCMDDETFGDVSVLGAERGGERVLRGRVLVVYQARNQRERVEVEGAFLDILE